MERRGNPSSEGWKWTLNLTPRTVFDPSPESSFGGGRQRQCSMPGGKNQPINPPNYPECFAEGGDAVQGQELGKSRNSSKPAHRGELLAIKQDASPAEHFLSHNHPSFPDKKKYLRSSYPPPSPVPLLAGSISEDCSTHPGVFI